MEARRAGLLQIVRNVQPATVRQVFYQATVQGVVEKTEGGYAKVQRQLLRLRRDGLIPYQHIVDATRWMRRPRTYGDPVDAINATARLYRKSLWDDADAHVEIWIEKDALAGVIHPITDQYDVPLMVARGFASETYCYEAAEAFSEAERPAFIYHLGDYDPSGQAAARDIEAKLTAFASVPVHFSQIAVSPAQIDEWDLPARPTKKTDSRAKFFGDLSVELDAIPPGKLRSLVKGAINQHLSSDRLHVLRVAEESERKLLLDWAAALEGQL